MEKYICIVHNVTLTIDGEVRNITSPLNSRMAPQCRLPSLIPPQIGTFKHPIEEKMKLTPAQRALMKIPDPCVITKEEV